MSKPKPPPPPPLRFLRVTRAVNGWIIEVRREGLSARHVAYDADEVAVLVHRELKQ